MVQPRKILKSNTIFFKDIFTKKPHQTMASRDVSDVDVVWELGHWAARVTQKTLVLICFFSAKQERV